MVQPENIDDLKQQIVVEIANLSRLLGMISNEDNIVNEARDAHLRLSVLIGQALDIRMP